MRKIRNFMCAVAVLLLLLAAKIGMQEPIDVEEWVASASVESDEKIIRIPEIVPEREEVQLPAAYDYRMEGRAPQIKSQGGISNCWAFAGISALESSLLPEEAAVYSTDHVTHCNAYSFEPEEGGAYIMAVSYLTGWMGPVAEAEDPSGDGESPEGLSAAKQVLDVRILDYKDYEAIKRTVYLYGGVESSIYMDFTQESSDSDSYNWSTYSYCYTGETEPNHDVLIIGWDDDYPVSRFQTPPPGDGAFICQNSWGERFGDKGVFYVSYYDSTIGGNNTAYTRTEDAGYFDALYQSDLCGWTGQLGYDTEEAWFANVYTAKEAETLSAAGFYTTGMDSTYEIYLVPEFTDESSLQNRAFLANGYFQYAGYHTVEFPKEVSLEAGQKFALVMYIKTSGEIYPIAVELIQEDVYYLEAVVLDDGESYISDKGSVWASAEETCRSNVCLKAYITREKE